MIYGACLTVLGKDTRKMANNVYKIWVNETIVHKHK